MAEQFRMAGVLRHRKYLEEVAQTAFAGALRRWSQARRALADLTRHRKQYQQELKHKMQANARADEIMRYHRYLRRLDKEIASQAGIVEALAVAKEEKRTALLAALKDRKIIEKLKARHMAAEARHERTQEQKHMNEAAVNRFQNRLHQADASE